MTIAFTICSINYLAQARTLGDSLKATNPDVRFFIGLVDTLQGVAFEDSYAPSYPMIEIDKIEIRDFQEMCARYNITELNTAVKPFYFTYFFKHYPEAKNVIYFDPDIIVFQPLKELKNSLARHNAVLTPHINTPIDDRQTPNELRNQAIAEQVIGLDFGEGIFRQVLHLAALHLFLRESDLPASDARFDDLLESVERAAADEEDVLRVDLDVLLLRMLATALRRY